MESARGILGLTSNDETFASRWLGTLQRDLRGLLKTHADRQQGLEHTVVKFYPVGLTCAAVHLSQHFVPFVKVNAMRWIAHYEPETFALLDHLLNNLHTLRQQARDYALVASRNRETLRPIVVSE